jgi:hypothetical protein
MTTKEKDVNEELSDQNEDDFYNQPIMDDGENSEKSEGEKKNKISPWVLYVLGVVGLFLESLSINVVLYNKDFLLQIMKNISKATALEYTKLGILMLFGFYGVTFGLISIVIYLYSIISVSHKLVNLLLHNDLERLKLLRRTTVFMLIFTIIVVMVNIISAVSRGFEISNYFTTYKQNEGLKIILITAYIFLPDFGITIIWVGNLFVVTVSFLSCMLYQVKETKEERAPLVGSDTESDSDIDTTEKNIINNSETNKEEVIEIVEDEKKDKIN